jgi:hypothetical protein
MPAPTGTPVIRVEPVVSSTGEKVFVIQPTASTTAPEASLLPPGTASPSPYAADEATLPLPRTAPGNYGPLPAPRVEPVAPGSASCYGTAHGRGTDYHLFWKPALPVAPLGTYVNTAFQLETDLAKAERLVLYQEDWVQGTPQLKDVSLYHLAEIADWLRNGRQPHSSYPVRVEPTGIRALDEARRHVAVRMLAERGVGDAEARVIIAPPWAEGLRYEQIERAWIRGLFLESSTLFGGFGGGFGGFGGFGSPLGGFGGFGSTGGVLYFGPGLH